METSDVPIQLVVARYREQLAWLSELNFPAIVYDKSDDPQSGSEVLPNVGRESHTYLTHIVRNYDRLAPMTVFLQGNPFDHLSQDGGTPSTLRRAILDAAKKRRPFVGFAWFRLSCDGLGRPHDLKLPENKGRWNGWGRDIPVAEIFTKLFDAPPPRQFVARAATGNFAVSAERIRTRPRKFYEYALRLTESDPDDYNNTGHAFERLWHLVFNGNRAWNREWYPEKA